jgi:hypothetical protein
MAPADSRLCSVVGRWTATCTRRGRSVQTLVCGERSCRSTRTETRGRSVRDNGRQRAPRSDVNDLCDRGRDKVCAAASRRQPKKKKICRTATVGDMTPTDRPTDRRSGTRTRKVARALDSVTDHRLIDRCRRESPKDGAQSDRPTDRPTDACRGRRKKKLTCKTGVRVRGLSCVVRSVAEARP